MMKVIFVCTGNTCRSPMAEKIFNKKAKEMSLDVAAISRGVACSDGLPMNVSARAVMKEEGLDFEHRSRMISEEDMNTASYVITVTSSHKRYLEEAFGRRGNVFSIEEITGGEGVFDPYGADVDVYRRCYKILEKAIGDVIEKLFSKR